MCVYSLRICSISNINIHSLCEEAGVGPTVNSTRAPQLGGPTEILISSYQDKSK